MQHCRHAGQMLRQKWAGKFHREKLVLLVRGALCGQRLVFAMIKANGVWREIRPLAFALHETVAGQIQTQFHAARMKTRGPVQFAPRKKIMPLDAVARAAKTAEDRLPAFAHVAPGAGFGERR